MLERDNERLQWNAQNLICKQNQQIANAVNAKQVLQIVDEVINANNMRKEQLINVHKFLCIFQHFVFFGFVMYFFVLSGATQKNISKHKHTKKQSRRYFKHSYA